MLGLKRLFKAVIGLIVIAPAAMAGSYYWLVPDLPVLDETERLRIPHIVHGSFVRLNDGITHYRWQGPEDGAPLVLVHGFSMASYVFNGNVGALTDQGFRVLTYDLYGRGLSDRPQGPYDLALFDRQLTELLDAEDVNEPIHLLGYSFGGAIAANFAAAHSERLKTLIFIAPAGSAEPPREGRSGLFFSALKAPLLGDWAMEVLGPWLMGGQVRENISKAPLPDRFSILYDQQERYAGYYPALLSTLRDSPVFGGAAPIYKKVGETDIPVCTIWGEDDSRAPFAQWVDMKRMIPQLEIHAIPDADHTVLYVKPDLVNAALVDFLSRKR